MLGWYQPMISASSPRPSASMRRSPSCSNSSADSSNHARWTCLRVECGLHRVAAEPARDSQTEPEVTSHRPSLPRRTCPARSVAACQMCRRPRTSCLALTRFAGQEGIRGHPTSPFRVDLLGLGGPLPRRRSRELPFMASESSGCSPAWPSDRRLPDRPGGTTPAGPIATRSAPASQSGPPRAPIARRADGGESGERVEPTRPVEWRARSPIRAGRGSPIRPMRRCVGSTATARRSGGVDAVAARRVPRPVRPDEADADHRFEPAGVLPRSGSAATVGRMRRRVTSTPTARRLRGARRSRRPARRG